MYFLNVGFIETPLFDGVTDYLQLSPYRPKRTYIAPRLQPGKCIIVSFLHMDLGPFVQFRLTFKGLDKSYINIRHIPL